MEGALSYEEVLSRVAAALICGFIVGIDREVKNKTVGIRTIMLITLTACGLMMLVMEVTHFYLNIDAQGTSLRLSPTGIVGSMVTGIGFLGAGAIINSKNYIIGTTTAATILTSSLIGLLCGFGLFIYALIFTIATFLIIGILGYMRAKFRQDLDNDKGDVANRITDEEKE